MPEKWLGQLTHACKKSRLVNSAAQYLYLNVLPALSVVSQADRLDGADPYEVWGRERVRVAFVCDEMTWLDLRDGCRSLLLSPRSWRAQLEDFRPQVFFCESAWVGAAGRWPDWRGRVYRNRELLFENRRVLLEILDYCRAREIPTVFWNKEDPPLFHPRYDFVDTALRFDWIFTTAAECVPRYRAMGHDRVYVLPFGVNTDLFYPRPASPRPGSVLFAGSWFGGMSQRCRDLCALLDHVLDAGMALDIYDRKSGSGEADFRFPKRYGPYIRQGMPYEELPALLAQYEYALNVNSVTDSQTMCSRRVLQLAACGMKIISNPSPAMERMEGLTLLKRTGGGRILYFESNAEQIAARHGTSRQFSALLDQVLDGAALPKKKAGAI